MGSFLPLRRFLGIHRYGLSFILHANNTLLHATVFPLDVLRLKHLRSWWQKNYFPLKLVKTVDLYPTKSYLFISVPHGILSMGIIGSFATDAIGCRKLFPGLDIRLIILDQHFKIPLFREYVYSLSRNS